MHLQLVLTAVISAGLAAGASWGVMHYRGESKTTDSRTIFAQEQDIVLLDEPVENVEAQIIEMLMIVGWHPDETGRPGNIDVITDEEVALDEHGDFETLLEEGSALLADPATGEPRERFALGRIAFLLGSPDIAKGYFEQALAKNPDIMPAKGYLILCEPTTNTEGLWIQYQKAELIGFTAARKQREELEMDITHEIDRFTADIFDLKKPGDVVGISDERLLRFHPKDIKAIIDEYQFYALAPGSSPRLAFGLGRAAYLHGLHDKEGVKALLLHAANQGYAPAHAYLGSAELADDIDNRIEHLKKAVQGGYEPAGWWLKKAERIKNGLDAVR